MARFQRAPMNKGHTQVLPKGMDHRYANNSSRFNSGDLGSTKSYVNVIKNNNVLGKMDSPAIVLDDDCVLSKDLSKSLMGGIKEFASLTNLKNVLMNEGFVDLNVRYIGELWVLLEFSSIKSKEAFRDNVGTMNTFKRITTKWGDLIDIDDFDDNYFHSKRLCLFTKSTANIYENFKIIIRGKVFWIRAKEVPGWIPDLVEDLDDEELSADDIMDENEKNLDDENCNDRSDSDEVPETDFDNASGKKKDTSEDPFGLYSLLNKKTEGQKHKENDVNSSIKFPSGFTPNNETFDSNDRGKEAKLNGDDEVFNNNNSKGDDVESVNTGQFKKSKAPRSGGSFLCLMEEVVKVGQTMGYNMDEVVNNLSDIIESHGASMAKKDWAKELCVKHKVNFLAIQETKMEEIDLFSVRRCWGNSVFDHLHSNSVGNSGGILYIWDPNAFRKNSFTISDSFIIIRGAWLMSGIDLMIIAVYAPHDPSDKCMLWDYLNHVINQWNGEVVIMGDFNEVRIKSDRFGSNFNVHGANIFSSFINSAGLEKVHLGDNRCDRVSSIANLKKELRLVDDVIDKGAGTDEVANKRMDILTALRNIDRIHSMDLTQKAKIKWSIEGDENSKFFHGILNKKRNQTNIRGIMVDGVWNEQPTDVKLKHFFKHGDIPSGCNSYFIALILKVPDANMVDFEKAFDSVRWDFLDDVLKKFGFGDKWCNWIQSCITSSRGSILVNGSPTNEFQFYKGLKQGDPLSPFLFILMMESLHISFHRIVDAGLFKGIVLDQSLCLSHMFYTDDVIFVGHWSDGNISTLIHVLKCFFHASGLRINLSKSKIKGVNVESDQVKQAAAKLGYLVLNTPFYYLGTKVGGSMSHIQAWHEIVEKVKSRLSKWKMKTL
nr:RNA-directed DNA polymerase, eukaryota [Tanacetum cinerariifolium]